MHTSGHPLAQRARVHAALGDRMRLAIVDELVTSDRTSVELSRQFRLAGNLLAHHLAVLELAGVIDRVQSAGDRRRRYLRLIPGVLDQLGVAHPPPAGTVLFVCTRNSARSQLAAALWTSITGRPAHSAGTEPAKAVHPGAVRTARRAGLDLSMAVPRHLDDVPGADVVITVCDRARDDLRDRALAESWRHWAIVDPVPIGTRAAFDGALSTLRTRMYSLTSPSQ